MAARLSARECRSSSDVKINNRNGGIPPQPATAYATRREPAKQALAFGRISRLSSEETISSRMKRANSLARPQTPKEEAYATKKSVDELAQLVQSLQLMTKKLESENAALRLRVSNLEESISTKKTSSAVVENGCKPLVNGFEKKLNGTSAMKPPSPDGAEKRPSTNTTEKKLNGFSGPGINGSMNGGVKVQPSVDVEKCSTYSFVVPQFDGAVSHGNAYRTLLHDVLTLLSSHVQMGAVLLEVDDFLPNSVNEVLRVAMGKSQLLMKKRLMQFKEQLERHLNPRKDDKVTNLDDLHGLWTLIDIQLNDIRQSFDQIDESRRAGWKEVEVKKPLAAATSMPTLRPNKANFAKKTNSAHKLTVDGSTQNALSEEKKAMLEEKRREEVKKREELIRARRAEMAKTGRAEVLINGNVAAPML